MVRTSLSLETQKMAQEIVEKEVEAVKNLRINNGAALVLNPKNGEIWAMVGSKDYFATDIDGKYNVTTALRQPGSAIKPINYLLALEKGASLNETIEDSRVTYYIPGQKPYSPQNYNGKYMGRVSLKTALASSLNTPSVKLLERNGVDNMITLAKRMGINTWEEKNRFGLSLALGSGEVKMTEISQAYGVLANLGEKVELRPILEIRNYLGEKIYESEVEKERVVDEENPFLINMALADNNARAPIFGYNSKLKIGDRLIAVKTGTTNSLRDNWCIGWTPDILVATWVGNNDNSPMSWVASGVSGATPIWNQVMTRMTDNSEDIGWKIPENIEKIIVCGKEEYGRSGEKINSNCSPRSELIGLE
jgi:membrane peptidoglycan carboxypeptidase